MKRIVIDASVVLKWFLADEKLSQPALALLDKYVSFELEIVAPSLLEYALTRNAKAPAGAAAPKLTVALSDQTVLTVARSACSLSFCSQADGDKCGMRKFS